VHHPPARLTACRSGPGQLLFQAALTVGLLTAGSSHAAVLWSDAEPRVTHNTATGVDILGGVLRRDDSASDTLYFRVRVSPLSDVGSEEYFAAFQLFEGDEPRLAVGNAPEAWGYSAFFTAETGPLNKLPGEFNLNSAHPEPATGLGAFQPYELPHQNHERTLVFKVQYVPNGDDLVTVWLEPDLSRGATDTDQPEPLTTKFKANASFDQIRLRHEGGGNGWIFSDMAMTTSFSDFVVVRFWQTWWFNSGAALAVLIGVALSVRIVEQRKYQHRLQVAERERAVARERARIAQDLHDELGSSLTRLSLLSDSLKDHKGDPAQIESRAAKISQTSTETVRALEEIVWALRPGSDTVQSLIEYIAHFAKELFEGGQTHCRLDLPDILPDQSLPPEMRHNIFLVVKEALTNAFKHAHAHEVLVQARVDAAGLHIVVADDGTGCQASAASGAATRNGLGNMQRRAEAMAGSLKIESRPGNGTRVSLSVCFPSSARTKRSHQSDHSTRILS
jgi:signal transduction histidine kinase